METRDFTTGENSASGSCGDLFADVMTETANAGTSKSAAAAVDSTDAVDAGRGTGNGAAPKGTAAGIKMERLDLRREEESAELRAKVSAKVPAKLSAKVSAKVPTKLSAKVSAKAASLRKNVADAVSKARRLQSCGAIEPAIAQKVINATRSANAYIRRKERAEGNNPYSTCSADASDRADVLDISFSGKDEARNTDYSGKDERNIDYSGKDEAKDIDCSSNDEAKDTGNSGGEANAMSSGLSFSDNLRCADSSAVKEPYEGRRKADADLQVEDSRAVGSRAIMDRVAERSLQDFDSPALAATEVSGNSSERVDKSSGGQGETASESLGSAHKTADKSSGGRGETASESLGSAHKTADKSSGGQGETGDESSGDSGDSGEEVEGGDTPARRNAELRRRAAEDGIQTLSNEELVSLLLNQSCRYSCPPEASKTLLDSNDGSLLGISERSMKELMMIPGIGIYRGVTILAIFELGRRLRNEIPRPKPVVISAQSAFELLRTDFQDLNHEESWVLFLNRANGLISKERISMGGVSATTLDPRIIVKRAVDLLASSFIIAHNHPSGNIYPGDQDKKMTVALRQAAALFNITLLDHLIVAGNKFFSFSDEGL